MQTTSNGSGDAYYLYQESGEHIGPVTLDLLARGIVAGKVPRDAHVSSKGDAAWRPALSIADIASRVSEIERRDDRSVPPMRTVPPATPPPINTEPDLAKVIIAANPPASTTSVDRAPPSISKTPASPKAPAMPRVSSVPPPLRPKASSIPPPPLPARASTRAPLAPRTAPPPPPLPAPMEPTPSLPLALETVSQPPAPAPAPVPSLPLESVPPPSVIPEAPTTSPLLARSVAPAPEKKEEKKDEKPAVVDAKTALMVPAAAFAAFLAIAFVILVIGLVKTLRHHDEPPGIMHGAATTLPHDE